MEQVTASVRDTSLNIPLAPRQKRSGIFEQIVHQAVSQNHRIEGAWQTLHLLHPIALARTMHCQTHLRFRHRNIPCFFNQFVREISIARKDGDVETLPDVDCLASALVGLGTLSVQADQPIAEKQPMHARSGSKKNPWAWVHVRVVTSLVVIDRLGFDRQRAGSVFGISVLGQPFFNPLERRIPIQNIDLRDHPTTDELVDLRRDLSKIRQQRTTDHQHQTTAEDLVVLEEGR